MCEKVIAYNNADVDLVNNNVYTNLVKFCPFILKILSKITNYVINQWP